MTKAVSFKKVVLLIMLSLASVYGLAGLCADSPDGHGGGGPKRVIRIENLLVIASDGGCNGHMKFNGPQDS